MIKFEISTVFTVVCVPRHFCVFVLGTDDDCKDEEWTNVNGQWVDCNGNVWDGEKRRALRRLDVIDSNQNQDGNWGNMRTGEVSSGSKDGDDSKDDGWGKDDGGSSAPRACYFRNQAVCPIMSSLAAAGVTDSELAAATSAAEVQSLGDLTEQQRVTLREWYTDYSDNFQTSWLVEEYTTGICPGNLDGDSSDDSASDGAGGDGDSSSKSTIVVPAVLATVSFFR